MSAEWKSELSSYIDELLGAWQAETMHCIREDAVTEHRAMQHLIGLAEAAPLLGLEDNPVQFALFDIARSTPASENSGRANLASLVLEEYRKPNPDMAARIDELLSEWEKGTTRLSDTESIFNHWSIQRIVGLVGAAPRFGHDGNPALSIFLERMTDNIHLQWALTHLTWNTETT